MHVQVVTYERGMMGEQEYIDLAHQIAPRVASVPGLLAAVWLDGSETGMYGGLFFWEDHPSMERFTESQLFASAFGPFGEVMIGHADVLENVTQLTQPSLQIVPPKNGQAAGGQGQGAGSPKRITAKKSLTGKRTAAAKKAATPKKAATGRRSSAGTAGTSGNQAQRGSSKAKKSSTAKKTPAARKTAGKTSPAGKRAAAPKAKARSRG